MHERERNEYRIQVGSQSERYHYEDQDIGGWIISNSVLDRKWWYR
jgi:hypothetical protein